MAKWHNGCHRAVVGCHVVHWTHCQNGILRTDGALNFLSRSTVAMEKDIRIFLSNILSWMLLEWFFHRIFSCAHPSKVQ
jgi:hypothetical protein